MEGPLGLLESADVSGADAEDLRLALAEVDDRRRHGRALACFDDRDAFAPTEHIWVSEKIAWVCIDDGLTQYQGTIT